MSKIRFTILSHGHIENDLAWNTATPNPGNRFNKNPEAIWGEFPSFSVLVEHSDLGWILYDTGCHPGDEKDRLPKSFTDFFPLYMDEQDYLENRLKSVGLTKDDIDVVILSHTHWDHSGGVGLFSGTKAGEKILTSGLDYSFGIANSHADISGIDGGYIKQNYQHEGLGYEFIDEDYKLAEGIELIALEGHSPLVLGLMLHMESGTYIFPSDAVSSKLNYGPPAKPPGFLYDSLGYGRAIKKLREMEKKYDAKFIFSHDNEQFKTLKKAPEFYE